MKNKINKAKENTLQIPGQNIGVNLDSPDISNAKSVEDLKKLNLFGHLNGVEQDKAYNLVFEAISTTSNKVDEKDSDEEDK